MNNLAYKRILVLGGGLAGMAILLAVLVAGNLLLHAVRLRVDLTENRVYTLSDGTRRVLAKLEAPVTLKLFFNESAPGTPMPLKTFARQVTDLLTEYRLAAGGQIILETYDPQPDTDAEEWAERYGLAGQNLGLLRADGATLYFGLVAVQGEASAVIPFLDPRAEELLEYHLTRLITRVANPSKPVVGLMSRLPLLGVSAFPYALPGQPRPVNRPPWIAFRGLGEDYDLRQLPMDSAEIDAAIDVLVLVHPRELSTAAQFAVDQFVLRGGRLLAFIDPLCVADAISQDQAAMMETPPQPTSDLGRLTKAWGLEYLPEMILADLDAATRIRQGEEGVEDSPVFLSLHQENMEGRDLITARLNSMVLPYAGVLTGAGVPGVRVTPLLVSSAQSQLVPPHLARLGAEVLRRDFKPGLKRLNLAVRLEGKFPAAFPEGRPPAGEGDEPAAANPPPAAGLTNASAAATVILVADVDLLFDAFAFQELPFLGQRIFQPANDNLNFFLNALEHLAGGTDLAQIRSRSRFDRPFDRVQALQREAQQRWLQQEQALEAKLENTSQRLEALQSQKDPSQRFILSAEQQEAIRNFKQEQARTQRELRAVRKNLREGIERLGTIVKVINIALVPALLILAGALFSWRRRCRRR